MLGNFLILSFKSSSTTTFQGRIEDCAALSSKHVYNLYLSDKVTIASGHSANWSFSFTFVLFKHLILIVFSLSVFRNARERNCMKYLNLNWQIFRPALSRSDLNLFSFFLCIL